MAEALDPTRCPRVKGDGLQCKRVAGHGTNHKGRGPCSAHGGRAPNWDIHFEKEAVVERMRTYGSPIDVEPHVALIEKVRRTTGHVAWLHEVVSELAHEMDDGAPIGGLTQTNLKTLTQSPSVWIEMYQEERRMLARVCKMALDAGVNERAVRVAEAQGEAFAGAIKAILADLGLSKEQQKLVPATVRKHLTLLAG
jgi:hypothetical protein